MPPQFQPAKSSAKGAAKRLIQLPWDQGRSLQNRFCQIGLRTILCADPAGENPWLLVSDKADMDKITSILAQWKNDAAGRP